MSAARGTQRFPSREHFLLFSEEPPKAERASVNTSVSHS